MDTHDLTPSDCDAIAHATTVVLDELTTRGWLHEPDAYMRDLVLIPELERRVGAALWEELE